MRKLTYITAAITVLILSACAMAEDNIQYETLTAGKAKCDVGILYKETEDGMELKVAGVATGKGSDFRRWEVTDIKLDANGESIRPSSTEKAWGGEESFFRLPAAFVFAAIGSQYERYGSECGSGQTCPVTGQPVGGDAHPGYKGSTAQAIDKAGMAAGLGLLTAQAKGEVPILKCSFPLNRDLIAKFLAGKLKVKIKVENKDKNETKKAEVDLTKQFSDFVKNHPGTQHRAGTTPGGTFVTVSDKAEEKKEGTPAKKGSSTGVYYGGELKKRYPVPQEYPGDKEANKKLLREEKMKKAVDLPPEGMAASGVTSPVPAEKAPSDMPRDENPMLKKNQDDYLRHSKRLKEIDPNSEEAKAIRRALPIFEKEIKEMGGEVPALGEAGQESATGR